MSSLCNLLAQKCHVCLRPMSKSEELPVIQRQHKTGLGGVGEREEQAVPTGCVQHDLAGPQTCLHRRSRFQHLNLDSDQEKAEARWQRTNMWKKLVRKSVQEVILYTASIKNRTSFWLEKADRNTY